MIPLPGGGGNPAPIVQYPNGYVLRGTPGVAGATLYQEGGGLARLLNRRRPSHFMMRRSRKPKSLEELQMMQGGGEESAP